MSSYAARCASAVLVLAAVHLRAGGDARAEERAQHIAASSDYSIAGRVGGAEVRLRLPDVIAIAGRMVEERRADARVMLRDGRTLEIEKAIIRVPRGWNDPDRPVERTADGFATFHCAMGSLDDLFRFVARGDPSARLRPLSHGQLVNEGILRAIRAKSVHRTTSGAAARAEAQAAARHLRSLLGGAEAPPRAHKVLAELDAIISGEPGAIPQAKAKEPEPEHVPARDLRRAGSRPVLPKVPSALASLIARDVTELALEGKLDPVVGRKAEIRRLAQGLSGRSKRNVILVGEPGVGKTALVDGLAQEIAKGDAPPAIRGKRVLEISMAQLTAGTRYRGEFEERLQSLLRGLQAIPEAERPILFIDEGHTIVGAGAAEGAMDASNILKPALARGELQVITATTLDEYRTYVKKDRALERRFRPLFVAEPRPETALAIIRAKRSLNQDHFKVTIGTSAMRAAVDLSVRFLPERRLPDKAQDVLEEAASRVAARGGKVVTRRAVEEVIQEWSGVPIRTGRQEAGHLRELESQLARRVFGQDEAVGLTARAVRRARAKMLRGGAKRPASLLFLGPTGVGKSELGKALAHELFGDESAALTFDMSEYAERHTASLLVGSPNGYVNSEDGGRLTNAVRARPFQVIVLDEIEKAHPDVINLLLQVLDEGRLSDRWGPVDFKNTIIIMTSNAILEAPKANKAIGFAPGGRDEPRGDPGDAGLRHALIGLGWRPELVNRVDGAALFNKLDARSLDAVVDKTLREVGRAYGIGVRASRAARDELLRRGTDPDLGARPIRRAAQAVEDVVADSVLSGSRERELEVDYAGGRFLARPGATGTPPRRKKATRVTTKLRQRLETRKATRAAGPGRGR